MVQCTSVDLAVPVHVNFSVVHLLIASALSSDVYRIACYNTTTIYVHEDVQTNVSVFNPSMLKAQVVHCMNLKTVFSVVTFPFK